MPAAIQTPRLGSSELEVSRPALGSWRTFERIPREDGLAVMLAAREQGLNFLDDARYDDETRPGRWRAACTGAQVLPPRKLIGAAQRIVRGG